MLALILSLLGVGSIGGLVWFIGPIRALGILKSIGNAIADFFKSLNGQGWVGLIVSAVLAILLVRETGEARHFKKLSDNYQTLYQNEKTALDQTVKNYRAAAEKARQEDAANKARVEAEQAKISKEQSDEYEKRIAAARALAERLRGASKANPSGPGASPVPGVSPPSGKPPANPSDGFSIDDRLQCTEQGIQLDELIKWNVRQHAVDPNNN